MCLILFALNAHPAYKLVLAANRDEFIQRPAHVAHYWHYYPDVLGGLDLEAGGTWLGITKGGRFTALTNVRDLSNINPDAPSRGELTHKFLTHPDLPMTDFAALLERKGKQYNGFNILWGDFAGDKADLFWYSNYNSEQYNRTATKITSGVHGLSNALLDTPWFKVERGQVRLQAALEEINDPATLTSALLEILKDRTRPDDTRLPSTGVSLEWERMLSSMFIETPDKKYGTRCSTVVLITRTNEVYFTEERFTPAFRGTELQQDNDNLFSTKFVIQTKSDS
jgi:uncharacterized protein with NRDE domain